jgi:hypothetical protein
MHSAQESCACSPNRRVGTKKAQEMQRRNIRTLPTPRSRAENFLRSSSNPIEIVGVAKYFS